MAKTIVTNTVSATHTTQIEGLREATFDITVREKVYGSDGLSEQYDAVDIVATGEATFENAAAYNQALAGVQANLVIVGRKAGGASNATFTAKNATFVRASGSLPTRQGGAVGTYRCGIRCQPGGSDTPATMVTVT